MTKQERKIITYFHSIALFRCDCGNDVMAAQKIFNGAYTGDCKCGWKWKIRKGMFSKVPTRLINKKL